MPGGVTEEALVCSIAKIAVYILESPSILENLGWLVTLLIAELSEFFKVIAKSSQA